LCDYFKLSKPVSFERVLTLPIATQHLKIAEGCSHVCSFCVIPKIRGPYKSRDIGDVISEAQWLWDQGARECILVSQDTSYYGTDTATSLPMLLEAMLQQTQYHWIRLMYLHPIHVTDSLLKLIAHEKRLCPYFDLPVQHIADPILDRMRRKISASQIRSLLERIRTIISDVTIRTSFIVGFPGETESHFKQLLSFIEWARFEKLGVFPFSPEEGTAAATMKPLPRNTTAQNRAELIMQLQRDISRNICESRINSTMEVIVDRPAEDQADSVYEGRTIGDAPEVDGRVHIISSNAQIGDFVHVTIIDADDYDLYARVVDFNQD
jgi:ribosomal protein S12 methylthiotransferase